MIIEKHKVVSVTYELRQDDATGAVVEATTEDKPLVFLFGVGSMLADFEANLAGKTVGDTTSFGIKAENAYGLRDESAVVSLPKNIFAGNEQYLKLGNIIPMQDNQGNPLRGKVVGIGLSEVKMDFNHPMAGQNLFFTVKVIDIRTASQEEIDHGHVHGPGGHHH